MRSISDKIVEKIKTHIRFISTIHRPWMPLGILEV